MNTNNTVADACIEGSQKAVQLALEKLGKVVVEHCCGYDDYNKEYMQRLCRSLDELMNVRFMLDPKNLPDKYQGTKEGGG